MTRVIGNLRNAIHHAFSRRLAYCIAFVAAALVQLSLINHFLPRQATFGYDSASNCIVNPVLLPGLLRPASSQSFRAVPQTTIRIAGYPVFSDRTCITMQAPTKGETETIRLANKLLPGTYKQVSVVPAALPRLASSIKPNDPVSVRDPLTFQLSVADKLFDYRLSAGKASVVCPVKGKSLQCATAELGLAQATKYTFSVTRSYNDKPAGKVFEQPLNTVAPVGVASSTIAYGQKIYDKPANVTLVLNRPAASVSGISLQRLADGKPVETIPISTELPDSSLVVTFGKQLPRASQYRLTITTIKAADGGYLATPFLLEFATSGGPLVTANSLASYGVAYQPSATLSFDSSLLSGQDLSAVVSMTAGGKAIPASVTINGNVMTVRSQQSLGSCATFSIQIKDNLQSTYGVAGGNAWSFTSRTLCQSVFSIGSSVQGRPLSAYKFGSGASTILFVGGTHGNETSSTTILSRWIDWLEANPSIIPAGRNVVVIPNINPDGSTARTRTNANNVDLNRNFPTGNWKQSVVMPDKSTNPNGGGNFSLSEPESKALASYTMSASPRMVLTYHATGNVVVPNQSGDSDSLAWKYAKNSPVYYLNPNSTGTFFEYDTTGAYEDWLYEKPGITTLLIELNSMAGNEFSGHLPAMRLMVGS